MKILLVLLFAGISGMAQKDTTAIAQRQAVPFHEITPENAFKAHIKNNTIRIYVIGGIVSAVREKELQFAKKHNVTFHDFGCVVPANLDFYDRYNQFVFEHLSQTYGSEWLKEISPNVIGINRYKEKI